MALSQATLRRKIYGCWLGKAVGGTLGTPHEGKTGPLALSFYDPVPQGSLPNDDLDLQVVWLYYLRTAKATSVTPQILAQAWEKHVLFPFDEYAIARRNHAWGLSGPEQGASDNYFGECMGAAIRSEVWACIAPGDPQRAAGFAWADAVVDHCGEGVWAEVFHAALQSAAFVEADRDKLIAIGLAQLPADSRLRRALTDTIAWWTETPDWLVVREKVMERYYTGNFTDVVCNLCFELIGWFDGAGDFGRAICTAVNCGLDTDCTGATLGALLGIIDPECIPAAWRAPIGETVVLSDAIVGITKPHDLAELTSWTIELSQQLAGYDPALGVVHPRRPQTRYTTRCPIPADESYSFDLSLLEKDDPPDFSVATPTILPGFWASCTSADFSQQVRFLRLQFRIEAPGDVKLLLYYMPRATAWVDGKRVLSVRAQELELDPFVAPSFHRAGNAAVILSKLEAGAHELVLGLQAPCVGTTTNLVFGVGDPLTNLWLPNAFTRSAPRAVLG